jgi:hypothetical protein
VADGGDEGQWAGGRRRADGLRRKAEGGRRKEDGLRRKADGGASYGCAVTWREFIRGGRKNLCGVKRVVGVRFSEVALLCGCCVLGGEVGVEFRLFGADVGVIGRARIGWARTGWGSASTCG